jgi:NTE family protein
MGNGSGRAVVLAAGGLVGTAWMAGLAAGLRRAGVDLGAAELVVGTSAGAIVGALLATGQDLEPLVAPRERSGPAPAAPDPRRMGEVFAVLGDPGLDPVGARRRVGQLAAAAGLPEGPQLAQMAALITARDWPDRRLLITAVDAESGLRQVWDRAGAAPIIAAVASSIAFPGAAPPITVGGRRYLDGGLWSGTNADLAAGARTLVLVQPFPQMFSGGPLQAELAAADAERVVTITPDDGSAALLGGDLYDRAAWRPVFLAGARQGEAAGELRAGWNG